MWSRDEMPSTPEMDRVIVGMCHHLNSRLAATNAYVYLLRRRDRLGEYDAPLQEEIEKLARSIQLMRSLCIDEGPRNAPLSIRDLVETAAEVMADYPDGPVTFELLESSTTKLVRADWTRLLRTILQVAGWLTRDSEASQRVIVEVSEEGGGPSIVLTADQGNGAHPSPDMTWTQPPESWGLNVELFGNGGARIELRS